MHKRLYITGIEKQSGKSFISLGLVSILSEQNPSFNCFKLFKESDDAQASILKSLFNQPITPLMGINEAINALRTEPDDLTRAVLEFIKVESKATLTYYEGSDFKSDNDTFEYEFNLAMAHQLDADAILIVSAKNRELSHVLALVKTALELAKRNHTRVAGVVINRVAEIHENDAFHLFKTQFPTEPFISIVPELDEFAHPSMEDIALKLHARVICGEQELQRPVKQITIAAKTVGNFLESRLDRTDMLIVTPDDRIDILLGSLLADRSINYPKIAGIVLTGGQTPGQVIQEIIAGLQHSFPVLLTEHKTYETATLLYTSEYHLSERSGQKINKAISRIKPYLLEPILGALSKKSQKPTLSPSLFLYELVQKAKKKRRHIVLPEGEDPRILLAANHLLERNIVNITLLGKEPAILALAKQLNLKLPNVQIIDIDEAPEKEVYAKRYFELRQHKNINLPIALERMTDPNYFAVMMVYHNAADGMVSGATHTTADTVRPALEIIKTKPKVNKVSSVFIMCLPTRVLIYGDCAINPEPDSAMLAEIASQAAHMARQLGISPKVALLSYSSGESGRGESVDKVVNALKILKRNEPCLRVEGPMQYDAAVDPEVAHTKLPHSKIAGHANVLIFPDLNTGNNTYKAVQRETGALAIGPVLLGLNKPVNDLSRGCTPQDIINTILITAIQSEKNP